MKQIIWNIECKILAVVLRLNFKLVILNILTGSIFDGAWYATSHLFIVKRRAELLRNSHYFVRYIPSKFFRFVLRSIWEGYYCHKYKWQFCISVTKFSVCAKQKLTCKWFKILQHICIETERYVIWLFHVQKFYIVANTNWNEKKFYILNKILI